jgi:cytoskeletal protein CcmA (bactofilin family)
VQGDVRSAKHIELAAKATVVGNVYYNLIEMVMGSEVNGKLMHVSANQTETKRISSEKPALPFESASLQEG